MPSNGKTPDELVAESDRLDVHIANSPDLLTLAGLIEDHTKILARQEQQADRQRILSYAVAVVAILATLFGVIGLTVSLRVEHNSEELNRTQQAIAVYCAQTNLYNAEAHDNFLALFTRPESQERVKAIADVAWPQRKCTVDSRTTVPELNITTSSPPTDVIPTTVAP